MKTGINVDENTKSALSSMKTTENVDGSPNLWPHAARLPHRSDDLLHVTQVYNVKQRITNNLRTIQASVPGLPVILLSHP